MLFRSDVETGWYGAAAALGGMSMLQLDALNRSSRHKSPFTTFRFIDSFLRHNAYYAGDDTAELWFLIAFDGAAPVGYLPLVEDPQLDLAVEPLRSPRPVPGAAV